MASRELLQELCARFQLQNSQAVDLQAAGGVDVAKRVRAGEAVDVVVLARNAIDGLAREGALLALAVLAQAAGISITLIASAVLIAFTGALVARSGADRASPGSI